MQKVWTQEELDFFKKRQELLSTIPLTLAEGQKRISSYRRLDGCCCMVANKNQRNLSPGFEKNHKDQENIF